MTRQQCLQSSNKSHAIHSIPYIRTWSRPHPNKFPTCHSWNSVVGPQKPLILTLWSNKSLLWSWSRALEYLMDSRIHHSSFYSTSQELAWLVLRKDFLDLSRWSPSLVCWKSWKWRKDFLDLSSWSPSLVWRLKRPNAYQPGQRSHYHTVIRKSFLDTFTSRFHIIQGLIQDMKFVFLKILSVWRNGLRRKWWRIDTWKAHWPSLRPNGDRCSFSSPSYADPSTHVVINNHQESSYLRYIPLHHRHRIACSDLDKKCWTRLKPISIVGKSALNSTDKKMEQKTE